MFVTSGRWEEAEEGADPTLNTKTPHVNVGNNTVLFLVLNERLSVSVLLSGSWSRFPRHPVAQCPGEETNFALLR